MADASDASCSSITSSVVLHEEDPPVAFLSSSMITCVSEELEMWPSNFLAAPPELLTTLQFDGQGHSGWYKTAFSCYTFEEDPAAGVKLVAKFRNSLVASQSRSTDEKGPFLKRDRGSTHDDPAWKRDYHTMLDDFQQQVILSILSCLYSLETSELPRIAYLCPVLAQAESETHSWYGIIEKALPSFKKPKSWLRSKWKHKDLYMKFRSWCQREHDVQIDDPQGLFCDGDSAFFTDGIIVTRDVGKKYKELLLVMQDIEDAASSICSDVFSHVDFDEGSDSETLDPKPKLKSQLTLEMIKAHGQGKVDIAESFPKKKVWMLDQVVKLKLDLASRKRASEGVQRLQASRPVNLMNGNCMIVEKLISPDPFSSSQIVCL